MQREESVVVAAFTQARQLAPHGREASGLRERVRKPKLSEKACLGSGQHLEGGEENKKLPLSESVFRKVSRPT